MISRFVRTFVIVIVALFLLATVAFLHPPSRAYMDPWTGELFGEGGVEGDVRGPAPIPAVQAPNRNPGHGAHPTTRLDGAEPSWKGVKGNVIESKLGNATAKAELGRATWKLLHTMTLRYPENPTQDEREALEAYMYLTSRLYPCGECAAEFQRLLETYPPQTASRLSTSLWLCAVHNEVNVRLGKPMFDCSKLDAEYDCGCGDDPLTPTSTSTAHAQQTERDDAGAEDRTDLERDVARDDVTGVRMIKGGRR